MQCSGTDDVIELDSSSYTTSTMLLEARMVGDGNGSRRHFVFLPSW